MSVGNKIEKKDFWKYLTRSGNWLSFFGKWYGEMTKIKIQILYDPEVLIIIYPKIISPLHRQLFTKANNY